MQDQAEEFEPVDLTPVELEAPEEAEPPPIEPEHIEPSAVEPAADEPSPVQMAPHSAPIAPSAFVASPANASDHDELLTAPLESPLTSGEQTTEFHVHDDPAQDEQVELVHLDTIAPEPVAEEEEVVDLEPEPVEAVAPPTLAQKLAAIAAPPPLPIEEEEVELEPFEQKHRRSNRSRS